MITTLITALLLSASPMDEANLRAYKAITSPDSVRVARAVAEAERFATMGRFVDAKRRYNDAIREERADDRYPAQALWGLATLAYGEGKEREAAQVLDELAEAAAQFADPTMELRARFEAAVIYARTRSHDAAARHLVRVRRLLQSPAISDEMKRSIQARLGS